MVRSGFSRWFVFVDQAVQKRSMRDVFMAEVRDGVGRGVGEGRARGGVFDRGSDQRAREHYPRVPLAEDQHSVGAFGL
jgi:hypothetical protein